MVQEKLDEWNLSTNYTYGIGRNIERFLLYGFDPKDTHEVRKLYDFSKSYFKKYHPIPHTTKHLVAWEERASIEATLMCDLYIKLRIDNEHSQNRT